MNDEKKMTGLHQLIVLKRLERRDTVLLTYRGEGNFEIVIFDKDKVEKVCPPKSIKKGNF